MHPGGRGRSGGSARPPSGVRVCVATIGVRVHPADDVNGVGQDFVDGVKVLRQGLGVAGEVDDERALADPGGGPGQHGVRSDGKAREYHRLPDGRDLTIARGSRRVWCHIACRKSGAASREDEVEALDFDVLLTGHTHDLFAWFDGRNAVVESGADWPPAR